MTQLPNYKRGDTWEGVEFTSSFVAGEPPEPASPIGVVVSARLQFRDVFNKSNIIAELSSTGDSPAIEVLNTATWHFRANPTILSSTFAGQSEFDLEVTYLDNANIERKKTTAEGRMIFKADVTR